MGLGRVLLCQPTPSPTLHYIPSHFSFKALAVDSLCYHGQEIGRTSRQAETSADYDCLLLRFHWVISGRPWTLRENSDLKARVLNEPLAPFCDFRRAPPRAGGIPTCCTSVRAMVCILGTRVDAKWVWQAACDSSPRRQSQELPQSKLTSKRSHISELWI